MHDVGYSRIILNLTHLCNRVFPYFAVLGAGIEHYMFGTGLRIVLAPLRAIYLSFRFHHASRYLLLTVLGAGIEPACLAAGDFKSPVYTISPPERLCHYNLILKKNKLLKEKPLRGFHGGVDRNRTGAWQFCRLQCYHFTTTPYVRL